MGTIKIIVERTGSRSNEIELFSREAPRGILLRKFEEDYFGRRRIDDDDGDSGGGETGGTPAAPTLSIEGYDKYLVASGVYSDYGYSEHWRWSSARVLTSRPFAPKLQYELARSADFSAPHQVVEKTPVGSTGLNSLLANRKFTCSGETFRYGITGTTQYLRARDWNGTQWSEWASIALVFESDYRTNGMPLEFTDACN